MYVICILCYIKIHQFRHPDTTPNALSVFALLVVLIFLEAVILNFNNTWYAYGVFLFFYLAMSIFVSFNVYYDGIGRIDSTIAVALIKGITLKTKERTKRSKFNSLRNLFFVA